MLKFKKTGQTSSSPCSSPVPSPRKPKLLTRLDSIGSPHTDRSNLTSQENHAVNSSNSSSDSDSDQTSNKLKNSTKKKLNQQKRNQVKLSMRKERNLLSKKDFYAKQQELKTWIVEMGFGEITEMSEKKLKDYFKKFVDKWNKKKLEPKYYRGIYHTPESSEHLELSSVDSFDPTGEHSVEHSQELGEIEHQCLDVKENHEEPLQERATPCSSFNNRFATVGRPSPKRFMPTELLKDDVELKAAGDSRRPSQSNIPLSPRTPPKPPVRRVKPPNMGKAIALLNKKAAEQDGNIGRMEVSRNSAADATMTSHTKPANGSIKEAYSIHAASPVESCTSHTSGSKLEPSVCNDTENKQNAVKDNTVRENVVHPMDKMLKEERDLPVENIPMDDKNFTSFIKRRSGEKRPLSETSIALDDDTSKDHHCTSGPNKRTLWCSQVENEREVFV